MIYQKYFWTEAIRNAYYVLKHVLIRSYFNKTLYKLQKDRKPNIGISNFLDANVFILNTKDNLGKFYPNFDIGIFLEYSNAKKQKQNLQSV